LGTEQKVPLSEAGAATPGRSQKTQQRSKVARTRILVGVVVALVVVGGVAFFATRGGDDGGLIGDIIGDGDDRPVPEVTISLKGTSVDATSTAPDRAEQKENARQAAGAVARALETMLQTAYVDPETWDDPDAVADSFMGEASDLVEADAAVLTLGLDAGDVYDYVEPGKTTATIRMLMGPKGEPLQAFADVIFPGLAEHDDGTYTELTITGAYFLVHEDATWRVVSYRVDRKDAPAQAPASPSASTSAEGSG
jgi:hypothetical protein